MLHAVSATAWVHHTGAGERAPLYVLAAADAEKRDAIKRDCR